MKKRFLSSVVWSFILTSCFLVFVLSTSPGDAENFKADPLLILGYLFPWFLGVSAVLFLGATLLRADAFSPLDLFFARRKELRRQSRNYLAIDDRVEELLSHSSFSSEDGIVVSSETIPVTSVTGNFSGGGGTITSVASGNTFGNISSATGSISSHTTLLISFFVQVGDQEYHIKLDAGKFSVRVGSRVNISWVSDGKKSLMYRIKNLQTGQIAVFDTAISKVFHDIVASKATTDTEFKGIPAHHLIARINERAMSHG